MGGWCLTRVGRDASSASLGWRLLPSTVIIVLALVNSTMSPAGTSSISTGPRSAALLPVITASTGLLHLLVGARVHRVRSDTKKYRVWLLPHAHHFQCVTYIKLDMQEPCQIHYHIKVISICIGILKNIMRQKLTKTT